MSVLIGGMDTFARAPLTADRLLQDSPLETMRSERCASFDRGGGARFERGANSLKALAALGDAVGEPALTSGRQELYENVLGRDVR